MSLVEAGINIAVGFCVSFLGQLIIFPVLGISVNFSQNIAMTAFFTVLSLARSYILRRMFNKFSLTN